AKTTSPGGAPAWRRGAAASGRLPTRWYATAFSSASTSPARCPGGGAADFGANAARACLAPWKPREAERARLHVALAGGHRHDRAEQVVRQQVNPDRFRSPLGCFAPQGVHLHRRFERADTLGSLPPNPSRAPARVWLVWTVSVRRVASVPRHTPAHAPRPLC